MDDVYEVSLLLDFYGQLLTDRQYEIMDLHYNDDFSLGEIAENLSISRQGVHDSIKKSMDSLSRFEQKLGLVKRFLEHKKTLEGISNKIDSINLNLLDEKNKDIVLNIKNDLDKIISQL